MEYQEGLHIQKILTFHYSKTMLQNKNSGIALEIYESHLSYLKAVVWHELLKKYFIIKVKYIQIGIRYNSYCSQSLKTHICLRRFLSTEFLPKNNKKHLKSIRIFGINCKVLPSKFYYVNCIINLKHIIEHVA